MAAVGSTAGDSSTEERAAKAEAALATAEAKIEAMETKAAYRAKQRVQPLPSPSAKCPAVVSIVFNRFQ